MSICILLCYTLINFVCLIIHVIKVRICIFLTMYCVLAIPGLPPLWALSRDARHKEVVQYKWKIDRSVDSYTL